MTKRDKVDGWIFATIIVVGLPALLAATQMA
jgi:hypothetical protein